MLKINSETQVPKLQMPNLELLRKSYRLRLAKEKKIWRKLEMKLQTAFNSLTSMPSPDTNGSQNNSDQTHQPRLLPKKPQLLPLLRPLSEHSVLVLLTLLIFKKSWNSSEQLPVEPQIFQTF